MSTIKTPEIKLKTARSERRQVGGQGEEVAARFLASRGFRVLERNWSCPEGEIDLVAEENGVLCFVEVRLKTELSGGHPLETVTRPKRRKLLRAVQRYLAQNESGDRPLRFDVVGIVVENGQRRLTLVRNAFEAEGW